MAGPLTWILELYDRVSGPAEKMSKATEHYEKSMNKAGESTDKMAKAQKELSAEKFAIMGEIAHQGAEAIEGMLEKVVEFGAELLKASDFAKSTEIIFSSLAGSKGGGKELFEYTEEYASKASITMQEAAGIFKELAKSGSIAQTGQNLFAFAQIAGDLSARTGQSTTAIAGMFSKIASLGQLNPRGVMQLGELGIPVEILAKHLGVTATNAEGLGKALAGNLPSGQKALQAIAESLAQMEGGKVGGIVKDLGDGTIKGHANKFGDALEKAMANFANTQGFERVLSLIDKMTARVGDPAFVKAISDFANAMVTAAEALERMLPSAKTLQLTLGGGGGSNAVGLIDKIKEKGFGTAILDRFHEMNGNSKSGFAGGWSQSGKDNAEESNAGFAEGIEAHSPSKVYERFGKYAADGFNIGFGNGADDLLGVPSSTSAPGGGGVNSTAGRGHTHVHQEFNITAAPGMDIEALAHRISELSATSLQSPLESLAISMGTM